MPDLAPIGVFACDSYEATRLGIASILGGKGLEVVGTAATVQECLACAPHDKVAVYVMGLNHSDPPGPTLIKALREQDSHARIVVYSAYTNPRTMSVAYEAGARAYVPKSSEPNILVEATRTVAAGGHYWAPGIAEAVAMFYISGAHLSHPRHRLTDGELKLFILLAGGMTRDEAAKRLGIEPRTAGNKAVTIRKKLGIERDEFKRVAEEYDLR